METEIKDLCVKNVTASQLPTITDVEIKFITEKNVMHVLEKQTLRVLQLQHGKGQAMKKRSLAKCVASMHNILIN
tara:strand:- start:250 stop:474 length:225 start_codon:yes stop_codon:yes gene_type:complete